MTDEQPSALDRLVAQVAAVIEHAREATHPQAIGRTQAAITDAMESAEVDLSAFLAPLLGTFANHPDLSDDVRNAFATLIGQQHQWQLAIPVAGLFALVRTLVDAALAPYATDIQNKAFALPGNQVVALSPAEIALGTLRDNPHIPDMYGEASLSGVSAQNLDALIWNTGDAISPEEALLLYRRGQLPWDDPDPTVLTVAKAIRESRIRNEWLPAIADLRYAPPSPAEILSGAVQNQLPIADAQTKFQQAGVDPANWQWMYDTHGRPPGPMEMLSLVNRGLMSLADFDQGVRESDIKNKYIPLLEELRVHYPPLFEVIRAVTAGDMTDARAATILGYEGYTAEDVSALIAAAHTAKTAATKELTQAQVARFYGAQLITRPEAELRLAALKYDTETIALLLDYEDGARLERYMQAVITKAHARYTSYRITRPEAVTALGADGITGAAADQLLALWDIERSINTHSLTPASIVGAYRRGEIGPAETKTRLLGVGVDPADLAIVVADGYPPTKPDPTAVAAVVNA